MRDLRDKFGDQIESYVDLIKGKKSVKFSFHVNERSENNNPVTQAPRTGPTSGDAISIKGRNPDYYGTIGLFALNSRNKLFAITNYHVCYNGRRYKKFCEQFEHLMSDCNDKRSETVGTTYCYRSHDHERSRSNRRYPLGTFHKGIFNNMHDLALVEIQEGVECNSIIPDIDEKDLTEKAYMTSMIREGRYPTVQKTGFRTGKTEGYLDMYCFSHKEESENQPFVKKAYRIKVKEGCQKPFGDKGDSGSLVLWEDEHGKKHPFAYYSTLVYDENDNSITNHDYVCFSLKDSLDACAPDITPSFD